jgi:peptidoglycan/xylan/chitin deacetylase (PgdA/CDA1 family)
MSAPGAGRALVLTWHSISEGEGPLRTPPAALEAQLDGLAAAGYEAISLSHLVEDLERGAELGARRFALSFDDGYRDFAQAALPILERRGLPSALFVSAGADRVRLPGGLPLPLLALEELPGLAARGVEIGAHAVSHRDLTGLGAEELERELAACAAALRERLGPAPRHFAYPYGRHDRRVRAAAARHFRAAFTTRLARVAPGVDRYAIPRVDAFYLRSPLLRRALASGRPDAVLALRGWLRRLRGSETRERSSLARWGTLSVSPARPPADRAEVRACP